MVRRGLWMRCTAHVMATGPVYGTRTAVRWWGPARSQAFGEAPERSLFLASAATLQRRQTSPMQVSIKDLPDDVLIKILSMYLDSVIFKDLGVEALLTLYHGSAFVMQQSFLCRRCEHANFTRIQTQIYVNLAKFM